MDRGRCQAAGFQLQPGNVSGGRRGIQVLDGPRFTAADFRARDWRLLSEVIPRLEAGNELEKALKLFAWGSGWIKCDGLPAGKSGRERLRRGVARACRRTVTRRGRSAWSGRGGGGLCSCLIRRTRSSGRSGGAVGCTRGRFSRNKSYPRWSARIQQRGPTIYWLTGPFGEADADTDTEH